MENKIITKDQDGLMNQIKEYLRNTGMSTKITDKQANMFISTCLAYNLNPIKKEAYAVPYNGTFQVLVGYEAYLKRAEETGLVEYWTITSQINNDGKIVSSTCEVKRKDRTKPLTKTCYFAEYSTGTALWKNKPITMLEKVATGTAFRLAFPKELGGLYTQEEFWVNNDYNNKTMSSSNEVNYGDEIKVILLEHRKQNEGFDIKEFLVENNIPPKQSDWNEETLIKVKGVLNGTTN